MMLAFFVLDDYTDSLDGAGAKLFCDATMDAVENPDRLRPDGESIVAEVARQ
jgi:hypothetical protein